MKLMIFSGPGAWLENHILFAPPARSRDRNMSRNAVVVENLGENALLVTSRRGACGECSQQGECTFETALGKDVPEKILARNPINARPGEMVEFDLPGHGELKVSILVWALPLVGLVAGAVLGSVYQDALSMGEDLAAFVGAMAGLAVTFAPVILYDRLRGNHRELTYVILRRGASTCDNKPSLDSEIKEIN
jgi:sigma-E factor negative regulatory protein RseC